MSATQFDDTLDGGSGNDTLDGGEGDDRLLGDLGDDLDRGRSRRRCRARRCG